MKTRRILPVLLLVAAAQGHLSAQPADCKASFDLGRVVGFRYTRGLPVFLLALPTVIVVGGGTLHLMSEVWPQAPAEKPILLSSASVTVGWSVVAALTCAFLDPESKPTLSPNESEVNVDCCLRGYRRGGRRKSLLAAAWAAAVAFPVAMAVDSMLTR